MHSDLHNIECSEISQGDFNMDKNSLLKNKKLFLIKHKKGIYKQCLIWTHKNIHIIQIMQLYG